MYVYSCPAFKGHVTLPLHASGWSKGKGTQSGPIFPLTTVVRESTSAVGVNLIEIVEVAPRCKTHGSSVHGSIETAVIFVGLGSRK